jgi:hypothetical protein
MKLNLNTLEDTVQLKYRVAASLKDELDKLHADCKTHKLNFTAALEQGLREVTKALRQELNTKLAQSNGAQH